MNPIPVHHFLPSPTGVMIAARDGPPAIDYRTGGTSRHEPSA
jgi:hypothetical protein